MWLSRFLYNLILGAEAFALVPFAVAFSRRRYLPYEFRPIFYYTIFLLFIWQLGWYGRVYLHNNVFCFHLTTILQISFLSLAYYRLIPHKFFRIFLKITYYLFLLIALTDALYLHGFMTDANLYARVLGNLLVVSFALFHIFLLTNQIELPVEKRPEFLLAVAVIFYYSIPLISNFINSYLENHAYENSLKSLNYITTLPFVLSSWVAMTLLSFMFMRFPLDYSPREALPEWLRWRRKRPARWGATPVVEHLGE